MSELGRVFTYSRGSSIVRAFLGPGPFLSQLLVQLAFHRVQDHITNGGDKLPPVSRVTGRDM